MLFLTAAWLMSVDKPLESEQKTGHNADLLHELSPERPQNAVKTSQHVTIRMLPEDVLLEIFRFYRVGAMTMTVSRGCPWEWHKLVHVCRRWQSIIFASSRFLDLKLTERLSGILCTVGQSCLSSCGTGASQDPILWPMGTKKKLLPRSGSRVAFPSSSRL
ncbi:hypothetical protein BJV78DRAFT_402560 [Lactifluus subvellereus]|nr:hypothetical protein BJV78DRAFT_402560 [Lactifluus subvellereus]